MPTAGYRCHRALLLRLGGGGLLEVFAVVTIEGTEGLRPPVTMSNVMDTSGDEWLWLAPDLVRLSGLRSISTTASRGSAIGRKPPQVGCFRWRIFTTGFSEARTALANRTWP
mmetsp:Transcript_52083/g.122280  ORF Transcript_52083/g.122280 Transcript_52083/m.122280 type:complete len:112 (+) Transcript_52083:252-587(+)